MNATNPTASSTPYPRLVRRIKGALVDSLVVPIAAIATLVLVDALGVQNAAVKIGCAVLIVLLLEPFAVTFIGGTIGHHAYGMRVRRKSEDKRLNLFVAIIRFVVKTLFGLPSFFVALISHKRQALHDVVAGSLVIYKSTVELPGYEILPENTREDEQRRYLSVWRRLLVIFLYWVLCYFCLGWFVSILFGTCIKHNSCSESQSLTITISFVMTLIALVVIAVLGWRGVLYGCRKQAAISD